MTPMLSTRNLQVAYGEAIVLRGLDLTVPRGGITALLGANGAGKTTLLRAISGILVQSQGEIVLDGQPILGMRAEAIARSGVAHVPDGRGTFLAFSVQENLQLAMSSRRNRQQANEDLEWVLELFPRLRERFRQQAGLLSGGEQQMLAISRALLLRPKLLLLDEPSFGLAPLIVKQIFEIVSGINKSRGLSVLLVEQNVDLALNIADNAYLLESGRIVLEGTSEEIRSSEETRRSYLGL